MGHVLPESALPALAVPDAGPIASSADPSHALSNGLAAATLGSSASPVIAATVTDDEEDEDEESAGVEARFFPPLSMQARRVPRAPS